MPSLGSTSILRGFKVSVAVLDAFLAANGVDETFGTPPFYSEHPDKDPISVLLSSKIAAAAGTEAAVDKSRFRVLIPAREGLNHSTVAYVTQVWATVFAHRELDIDRDLPSEAPAGFEGLKREILSFTERVDASDRIQDEGRSGVFMVYTYDIRGEFAPQELRDRHVVPCRCDQCEATFDHPYKAFALRQEHRRQIHGSKDGDAPLPNA
ncbi:hypothetical protein VMCG_10960 [Cytospora schulzeri]|uniref:C2H2-type domain-containing protein n=1 Tax=Cytospora schulzeri TaxID=448051 RepID=A0A423V7F7_9PEZI|nr:hypothetical protein VMCG_10960 [Valsa malicola]